jgi:hypothetical protein
MINLSLRFSGIFKLKYLSYLRDNNFQNISRVKKMANLFSKALLSAGSTIAVLFSSILPSLALPNGPVYVISDVFKTSANQINIRNKACGPKIVGGVNKGVLAYYTGESTIVNGACQGLTNAKWRKVFLSSPLPNGEGSESVEGWVADKFLDNLEAVRTSKQDQNLVKVSVGSGSLNLRANALTGNILTTIPRGKIVEYISMGSPVVISGVKRYPTKIKYNGKTGFVDGNFLVAFSPYD